jgi:4-diphosphocytidyl-2-C-methyl-D-erythritol kinase
MVVFPNAKINIGLQVVGKRADGYHNLETIFFPVDLKDALEVIDQPAGTSGEVMFSHSGNPVDISTADNLCFKAYHLLKRDFPFLPAVKIHLHKNIPMGAGLGGGSADAAFMLSLLNTKYQLGLSEAQLIIYSLTLGSDCPFFIINKPCFAAGRGEKLEALQMDLSSYRILVVNPGIHINTGLAFKTIVTSQPAFHLKEAIGYPVTEWRNYIINDFEIPVFREFPAIKRIKEQLYDSGAVFALMSGSGSTVYGIFNHTDTPDLKFLSGTFHKWV